MNGYVPDERIQTDDELFERSREGLATVMIYCMRFANELENFRHGRDRQEMTTPRSIVESTIERPRQFPFLQRCQSDQASR